MKEQLEKRIVGEKELIKIKNIKNRIKFHMLK
jgi:hypothetical protein